MKDEQLDALLLRYLDGTLEAPEEEQLSAVLERDAAARARLRSLAEQAFAVGEAGRCREARMPLRPAPVESLAEPAAWWRGAVPWAAAAAVALGLFLALQRQSPRPLLEVLTVRGEATWSDSGQRLPLTAGARVAAGTIETESESATVEVRFADGTRFALSGGAEAVFSEGDRKQVLLKRGSLTAAVAPQAPGRPLRVRSSAAEAEVLGTVFTLDAMPQHTDLSVAEGRVRLKRLVDGREVEVAARQRVTASLVATERWAPEPLQVPATEWQLNLSAPPEHLTGVWQAATDHEVAFIGATPTVETRSADGRVHVHRSVIIRAASNSPADAFALLTADSVLRLKLRLKRAFPLQLMISARRLDGSYAGNFELVKQHPELPGDGHWHTLEVPFRDFKALQPERASVAAGNQVNVVIITTLHEPVGLEVAAIAILPRASGRLATAEAVATKLK